MPETNFLSPLKEQEKAKKSGKKKQKKAVKSPVAPPRPILEMKPPAVEEKKDKAFFKLKDNLNTSPAMPRAKLKIEENLPKVKKSEVKNIYKKIAFSFIALTIILVFAVLYFGFSKVTLTIVPIQEKITNSLTLEVVDKVNNSALSQGQIQGLVRQLPVEQVQTFTSSGKEVLGEEVSGKVTIINSYMKNQPLVATTRLLAPGNKLFRLRNTVNVPAGGQVEAEVYADEPSASMAIAPSRFIIPGLWAGIQDKIYAVSSAPMQYSEKVKYTIKQSDIDNSVSELKNNILANAKKEFASTYPEYNQSIFQVDNNLVNQEVQGKVGEEKENFVIKMKAFVTVVAFKESDVYEQARQKLAVTLADDREVVGLNQSDIVFTLEKLNLNQAVAEINLNFTAKVTLKNSGGIIKKNNLTGLNVEQVKAYLKSLPEVAGYEIRFFPSFIKKMPSLVDRIEIVIKK